MTKARLTIANAYALFALIAGLLFIAVTPPFGSGDETAHFERAYEIATGAVLGAEGVPAGMQAFIDDAFGRAKSGEPVNQGDFRRWRATPLEADTIVPYPEPLRAVLRLHSPLCYAHFAPVMASGIALKLPPLAIFYLGRLAALLAGVFLVRAAIDAAPEMFRAPLAFFGLMPTTVVYFSAFNIESLLVGLGFLFSPSSRATRRRPIRASTAGRSRSLRAQASCLDNSRPAIFSRRRLRSSSRRRRSALALLGRAPWPSSRYPAPSPALAGR